MDENRGYPHFKNSRKILELSGGYSGKVIFKGDDEINEIRLTSTS